MEACLSADSLLVTKDVLNEKIENLHESQLPFGRFVACNHALTSSASHAENSSLNCLSADSLLVTWQGRQKKEEKVTKSLNCLSADSLLVTKKIVIIHVEQIVFVSIAFRQIRCL